MSEWALKRFWKEVSISEEDGGFAVRLDQRSVRTPAKRVLVLPTRVIADRVAAEWEAQVEKVDPGTMPWTRSANAALDKVATQRAAVIEHLASYAGTDLLSYRAKGPDALIARQCEVWDPILDWVLHRFDAKIAVTQGVMPVAQDPGAMERIARTMEPMSDFQLTAFHDLVTLTGSFMIALQTAHNVQPAPILWAASRVDEDWQIEQWGVDEQAAADAEIKKSAFLHATELYHSA